MLSVAVSVMLHLGLFRMIMILQQMPCRNRLFRFSEQKTVQNTVVLSEQSVSSIPAVSQKLPHSEQKQIIQITATLQKSCLQNQFLMTFPEETSLGMQWLGTLRIMSFMTLFTVCRT